MGPLPSELAYIPFVSVENMMRLVHHFGIEAVLAEMTDAVEADYRRWEQFEKTPRLASHSRDGVIELMPTSDAEAFSFKYVNGHPSNAAKGYQTVAAFGLLARVDTGYPLMLTEMTLLTALRTAATSAMVARYLAPAGAKVMAMIGNGAQAEFQALAMKAVVGIAAVRLFDIDPKASEKVARNLRDSGLHVTICANSQEAIEGAQIITTCTADKAYATILTDNMVGAGIHINAIGGDCPGKTELHKDILRRAETFVEFEPQTRIEGEIQQMDADYSVTEFWRVLKGEAPGRRDARQITLFDSVGFATEDFSALRYVYSKLQGTDFFQNIDILADPDDPRDLFGMLQRAA
ncbi:MULTISPECIES: ornithine cyclodeaminase [unclassified Sphingomonas]|uniref:ornithine cyclodeaminase n=1 Tax=unclassified Sphingomonas TaxID=196159 RepID=UPI0006F3DECA|nr:MULTISPECIES: ornithine cyclodeaminase [unclassified Sphingomonas]KQX25966.1 ornithine cyclodeaminase [Sphingomonas sp. Root1294]KQY69031.1 ornithine cyclodeaminase [Sphingomonas sp. Root50]KRB89286.1 ornithine cyclodeaminase [Sphingomonas sp. Root720]